MMLVIDGKGLNQAIKAGSKIPQKEKNPCKTAFVGKRTTEYVSGESNVPYDALYIDEIDQNLEKMDHVIPQALNQSHFIK